MKFYNRNGRLYLETYEGSKRIRKSLKMLDTAQNRALVLAKLGISHTQGAKEQVKRARMQAFKTQQVGQINPKCYTIASALEKYWEQVGGMKPTSLRTMQATMRTALKLLGNLTHLEQITKESIHNFYKQLNQRANAYSASHIKGLTLALKNFLDFAMEMDYIQANPFFKPKRIANTPPKQKNPLNANEVQEVLGLCHCDVTRLYLMIAFCTGARIGEILALKHSDLNFANNTISIERSISTRGEILSPKTTSSVRTIQMPAPLREFLLKSLKGGGGEFLFNNPTGRRLNFTRAFHKLLAKAGLAKRPLYCTRHTFASIALNHGANLLYTSALLGHKNAHITLKTYARYLPQESHTLAPIFNQIKGVYYDRQV
ncbi:tyrosine-type recombinase/integrase [Helicobacter bizzozeronii]|uniref:tyrosine-type recombinase/integrase n=1 Tax=Helicobacter bizzozeronii TaxID=56877 RepID=UPI000CEE95D3|nr:site-specific integrase [Helicobacter bizzozeronii]